MANFVFLDTKRNIMYFGNKKYNEIENYCKNMKLTNFQKFKKYFDDNIKDYLIGIFDEKKDILILSEKDLEFEYFKRLIMLNENGGLPTKVSNEIDLIKSNKLGIEILYKDNQIFIKKIKR